MELLDRVPHTDSIQFRQFFDAVLGQLGQGERGGHQKGVNGVVLDAVRFDFEVVARLVQHVALALCRFEWGHQHCGGEENASQLETVVVYIEQELVVLLTSLIPCLPSTTISSLWVRYSTSYLLAQRMLPVPSSKSSA